MAAATATATATATAAAVTRRAPSREPPRRARLVATPKRYDFDVFGCQPVEASYLRDLYVGAQVVQLNAFIETFRQAARDGKPADIDFEGVQGLLSDLVFFVTCESDNLDVLLREGLPRPRQQVLMREARLVDLCMTVVQVVFETGLFSEADLRGKHRALHVTCKIAQRLLWHMLRQCTPNRMYAAKYVGAMQRLLGYSIGVASTLTEVFTDNEALLDAIEDSTNVVFLDLIRGDGGRQARYLDFLISLCHSNGKAVRINQWRVCAMLVDQRPELLINLRLEGGKILVEGDPAYFPAFKALGRCELNEWVHKTAPETLRYFERSIDLFGDLCDGRNLRNTPFVRGRLPYELIFAAVQDEKLSMELRSKFMGLLRDLYIDSEPHEEKVELRLVRQWDAVDQEKGRTRAISRSQADPSKGPPAVVDPHKFDALRGFIGRFLAPYFAEGGAGQVATQVETNTMILEVIKVLYHLLRCGFYPYDEIPALCRSMLHMLDGKNDTTGLENEREGDRYRRKRTVRTANREPCDTLLIMEAKLWLCYTLNLVCTARLDLRLSLLLSQYRDEFHAGVWKTLDEKARLRFFTPETKKERKERLRSLKEAAASTKSAAKFTEVAITSGEAAGAPTAARMSASVSTTRDEGGSGRDSSGAAGVLERFDSTGQLYGGVELGNVRPSMMTASAPTAALASRKSLSSKTDAIIERSKTAAGGGFGGNAFVSMLGFDEATKAIKARKACMAEILKVFDFSHDGHLVEILVDLTRYDMHALASQAIGLLVRQFEQRTTLVQAGRKMQLLVKPKMVESHALLEGMMRKLNRLAARRRLYDHEIYEAAWLMSDLTIRCFDEEDLDREGGSIAGHSRIAPSRAPSGSSRRGPATQMDVDHTKHLCLSLVGRATVKKGATVVTLTEIGIGPLLGASAASAGLSPNCSVWICGDKYKVAKADDRTTDFILDAPYKGESADIVWVQVERRIGGPDHDIQLLLSKLGTVAAVMQLLQLPFDAATVRADERKKRALLCGAYRLLKAMCNEFPVTQKELARHLPFFQSHTEAQLVEADISPTGCIIAICDGNREACTKVSPDMVLAFAKLAGKGHSPRFLRFLRKIVAPSGDTVITRNQNLVVSSLMDCREALLLHNDEAGRAERERLIRARDMELHPRGKLVYHVELVSLLAVLASSDEQEVKAIVREMVSLKDLCGHLVSPPLDFSAPDHVLQAALPLRASYLAIFRHAYVGAGRRQLGAPLNRHAGAQGVAPLSRRWRRP